MPDPLEELMGLGSPSEDVTMINADLSVFLSSTQAISPIATEIPSTSFNEARDDASYFNFFLTELSKCFPYVNLFPWTAATLFSTSLHNPALRQSVLAVAALTSTDLSG